MILEPLGGFADDLRPFGRILVPEVHHALPRTAIPQRIAVTLDKTVHEIDFRGRIPDPQDAVLIELLQIAALIKSDQRIDRFLLTAHSHIRSLLQPVNDLFDRRRIHASHFPNLLH